MSHEEETVDISAGSEDVFEVDTTLTGLADLESPEDFRAALGKIWGRTTATRKVSGSSQLTKEERIPPNFQRIIIPITHNRSLAQASCIREHRVAVCNTLHNYWSLHTESFPLLARTLHRRNSCERWNQNLARRRKRAAIILGHQLPALEKA